jgi:hypothetical protein
MQVAIAVVVLLGLPGCGGEQGEWLTVTDDPGTIVKAREQAERVQDQEIEALLAHLDDSLLDTDAVAILKGKSDRRMEQLRQIAHSSPITAKTVGAAVALCTLEDSAGLVPEIRIRVGDRVAGIGVRQISSSPSPQTRAGH